jgi:hypothetical protein
VERPIVICGTVKGVIGRDVALESQSSPETDGLSFSLYAAPSHNCHPVFRIVLLRTSGVTAELQSYDEDKRTGHETETEGS